MKILISTLFILFSVTLTYARVGEDRSSLESRLLQREIGVQLSAEQAAHQRDRAPYHRLLSLPREDGRSFYEMGELVVYFKTDQPTGDRVRAPSGNRLGEGWTLHVFYVGNRSMLEFYNRHGQDLSDFERNAILGLHRGSSNWRELEEDEEPKDSALQYNFERTDGALRARVDRGGMMVFTSSLDRSLYERRQAQRSFEREEQRGRAPTSVQGF